MRYALLLVLAIAVFAQTPTTLLYQGKLTNTDGLGINSTEAITFRLYDSAIGGTPLWSETHAAVDIEKGLFNVELGSVSPILLSFDVGYWLEIEIDGDILSPRQKMTSEAYAFRAKYADELSGGIGLDAVLTTSNSTGGTVIIDDTDDVVEIGSDLELADSYGLFADNISPEGADTKIDFGGNIDLRGHYINNSLGSYAGRVAFNDNIVPVSSEQDLGDATMPWDDVYLGNTSLIDIDGDSGADGDVLTRTATGLSWAAPSGGSGADGDWTIEIDGSDTTLVTGGNWGLFRKGSIGFGENASTHVNLGVACTTSEAGFSDEYCTVLGGLHNVARFQNSVVAGGRYNVSAGHYSGILGGIYNVISGADYSAIPGGYADTVSATNSFAFGYKATVPVTEPYSAVFNWEGFDGTMFIEADAFDTYAELYVDGDIRYDGSLVRETSIAYGDSAHTHTNLGVACTTGAVGHSYMYASVAGGYGNVVSSSSAFVGGGSYNEARGFASVIAGGGGDYLWTHKNIADANFAAIGGGRGNHVEGSSSNISGGEFNIVQGGYSVVAGGVRNEVEGMYSAVPGGYDNEVYAENSFAFGVSARIPVEEEHSAVFYWSGDSGTVFIESNAVPTNAELYVNGDIDFDGYIKRNNSVVYGDSQHTHINLGTACTTGVTTYGVDYPTVSGGYGNSAKKDYATVAGGYINTVSGMYSFIGGGFENIADGIHSVIGGGGRNEASYMYATIGGGFENISSNEYSTVCGGKQNVASGHYSSVGGGQLNTASAFYTHIGGGSNNIITESGSVISGGSNNDIGAYCSAIAGGDDNTVDGDYSFGFGRGLNISDINDNSVVFNWSGYSGTVFVETNALGTNYELYVIGDAYASVNWISSDSRLKRDIAEIQDGLNIISRLRPVSFQWDKERIDNVSNDGSLGFIAQELQEVLPDLVSVANEDNGQLAVNYSGIIPVNTAAIQELAEENEELRQKNQELQERIERLEELLLK